CAILEAAKEACIPIEAAVTVAIVEEESQRCGGEDERYAVEAVKLCEPSNKLVKQHSIVRLTPAQLVQDHSRPVIEALQLWGYMETRNSLIISAGLAECHRLGLTHVLTGDNADELWGGSYDIMMDNNRYKDDPEGWKAKRDGMADLPFVTEKLGAMYGITILQPLVDWAVRETTRSDCIDNTKCCAIQSKWGGPWQVQNCGKLPLREAFATVASWRRMDWIFRGSTAQEGRILLEYYNAIISDEEFQREQASYKEHKGVVLPTKEHLHNIRIFESLHGGKLQHPTKERFAVGDPRGCVACCFDIGDEQFCHLCDQYPAQHPKK
ncbi:MAG: hypothetical protein SGILL_002584, partial [Bacillariaceae sp.]